MTRQSRKTRTLEALHAHPFRPAPGLSGGHRQTLAGRFLRGRSGVSLERERWQTPDDDFLDLHFLRRDPSQPTVLLLHGLEGCAQATYLQELLSDLAARDWNAAVLEFRSCGGEMNRARRLYHSGETTDIAWVVTQLLQRFAISELFVAGYSLGGNVTAKWLGEIGDAAPEAVRAAAVVSAPYDLVVSGQHMDHSLSRFYVRHFLRSLIPKAVAKEKQYPGCMDIAQVIRARTFEQFDDHATAPLHGYADARDYYVQVSCGRFVGAIRRPTLLLSSADDPFNPGSSLPRRQADESPYLHPLFTERGGHVGFLGRNETGFHSWAEAQVLRFFELARKP